MQAEVVPLILSSPQLILTLDLTPTGGWVGITALDDDQFLSFNGALTANPAPCAFPIIRAFADDRVLVVNARSEQDQVNAWIITSDGQIGQHFCFGDAIADVILFDQHIAVTYFDEAFGNSNELYGVCVFDAAGKRVFGYPTVECYCACALSRTQLLTFLYPAFPIVVFDLATGKETRWATPHALAGAKAVTAIGDVAFLHAPYHDRSGMYRWVIGSASATRVGEYAGPLRGLRRGRFLDVGEQEYTILSGWLTP